MSEIDDLIDRYHSWLRDKSAWRTVDRWTEITAPYLDRNNDYLQLYLRKSDDGFILTDDGETIQGLLAEGCTLDSPKRQTLLRTTLAGYGVHEEKGKLTVRATLDNFALKKHSLVQAMLAVGDMFYLAEPHIVSLFMEDVKAWLDEIDVRYSENISFVGKSGYARKFDFLIPKSRTAPERIIKTINNPARHAADSIIMDWIDTKDSRQEDAKLYAVVNDNDRKISSTVIEALESYDISSVIWSNRNTAQAALAA